MTTLRLPQLGTSFVGRAEELAEISSRLTDPACRVLTLVGPGGCGKTRLAIQGAEQKVDEFPDGVYFVSLTSISTFYGIVPALANAVGLYTEASTPPKQGLFDFLRQKRLLLVLDNFEHLLEGARLIPEVLEAAPDVKVIVTSREPLSLQEEWLRRVEGLRFPAGDLLEHVDDYGAIRLFVERARRVRADFSLAAEREGVVRICQLVQGMPLGIELAAVWVRTMSCASVADEIQASLDFLTSPLRDVPERHRSMRAVFDHSWRLLTPEEQRAFRSLAVFRGGFTRAAADRIAGASLAALTALLDKSLLQWTPPVRYDLHELLRQYAGQHLEAAGERATARAAHSAFYLDLLARRNSDVKGRQQRQALNEIRSEFENIRVGWRWAVEHHEYRAISLAINCLVSYAEMSNRLSDVFGLLDDAADTFAPKAGEVAQPIWDQVVVRREWLKHRLLLDVDSALVETILRRARERGDREEMAWCLWVLADRYVVSDSRANAEKIAEEALALRRALGDEFYIAHALMGLHSAYVRNGQGERSSECVRESAAIRRKLGDTQGLSLSLSWLGAKSLYEGRLSEAESHLDEALQLQDEIGKAFGYVTLKALKAAITFWRGDLEHSARLVQDGLDFAQDQNPFGSRSLGLAIQSFAISLDGDHRRGRALCEQAGASYRGDSSIWIDWGMALAACSSGDDLVARHSVQAVLREVTGDLKATTFQWLCLPLAAMMSARDDQPGRAAELLGVAQSAPPMLTGWLKKWPLWNEVQRKLEAQLGEAVFQAALQRGQAMSLGAVVRSLVDPAPSANLKPLRATARTANRALVEPLSVRELEVLQLVAEGLSNAEVAARLVIAVATVKVHARTIYGKLGVTSRTQAIDKAQKLRLLSSH
jgi:predicted ATPase/DNA-binding CsgD family transcriptional regulator